MKGSQIVMKLKNALPNFVKKKKKKEEKVISERGSITRAVQKSGINVLRC